MANAPFGPNMTLSKEEYAKQIEDLEKAEKKHLEETEPKALRPKSNALPEKIVFHDFDYINPLTNMPEGSKLGDYDDANTKQSSPARSKK